MLHGLGPSPLPGLILALCALVGCGKRPAKEPPPKTYILSSMTRPVPADSVAYGPSHAVTPRDRLLAWLRTHSVRGGRRVPVKLPVVVTYSVLGLGRAFVGTSVQDPGTDKLPLALDDGRLGIPLLARIHRRCGKKTRVCALWLEGYWGPALSAPTPGTRAPRGADQPQPFTVMRDGAQLGAGAPGARAHVAK